jgi:Trypsin-like peptidase domain/von Willebrand factor type A domain
VSHITGTIQPVTPVLTIGPDSGVAPSPPNTWKVDFAHTQAAGGTKFLLLHFGNVTLPANNRLEVDLGYDTDVFTSADGTDFWTRPVNIYALAGGLAPIRYITDGATTGSVQLDKYGRGERHVGEAGHPSNSNCDPFLKDPSYTEPTYDPFWYCADPPNWENATCPTPVADVRALVARSVGMIVSVEAGYTGTVQLSTCSVTLVDPDKVITAGHCHTPDEALTSSVSFDYQTDCAGNRPAGYNAKFYKVKAVLEHRYDNAGDYSLLQLAEAPPGIPAIQMRHDLPAPGEQVFGVHHPNGAVKKLSVPHPAFTTVLASSPSAVNPSTLHVSGGSSGSGLFDAAGRIVGVLSNGNPCGVGGVTPTPLAYFPTASILKDIAPAPPPPLTRDVMVVFDRSGSMSELDGAGRMKIDAARDALSLFIQLVKAAVGNRVGLVSFSTTANLDAGITALTANQKLTLIGGPPYTGGKVGALSPGGFTSIGGGLDAARLQFPSPGLNPRAILLLTDGIQNTPPMVSAVAGGLTGIDVHAIGFGTAANLDGALLTNLAAAHSGIYSRAESGLALEKFFSHAFGNIFEAGIVMDPEFALPADQRRGEPHGFQVCGEEALTLVVGWDRTDATLLAEVTTPGGATITGASAGVEESSGRTWTFLRIPLPYGGERNGAWQVTVFRPGGGGEFPPPAPALRYFVNVVPSGGPRLRRWPDARRYYTGDVINPLVLLRYADGTWPQNGKVQVTVSRPEAGAGNILTTARLRAPETIGGDTIPARQATLAALEREIDGPIVPYKDETIDLGDESEDTSGAFESAALFGKPMKDLLTFEGDYTFHFQAAYGEGCTATRELLWSLNVDVGIDPTQTDVTTTVTGTLPDGRKAGVVILVPRDRYGNHLGPGRSGDVTVGGVPGTTVTAPVQDNNDGSYTVPVAWDPASPQGPGVVVGQPDRAPVVVHDATVAAKDRCRWWRLLFWLLLLVALALLILLLVVWLG